MRIRSSRGSLGIVRVRRLGFAVLALLAAGGVAVLVRRSRRVGGFYVVRRRCLFG